MDRLANLEPPTEEQVRRSLERVSPTLSATELDELTSQKMARINEPGYHDAFAKMMKTMVATGTVLSNRRSPSTANTGGARPGPSP